MTVAKPNRGRTPPKPKHPEYDRIGAALGTLAGEFISLLQRIEKLENAARAADREG